jgi:hypothetical protein
MKLEALLLVGLAVLGGAGCASGPSASAGGSASASVDISGKWQGTWVYQNQNLGSGQIVMTLTQTGSKATGSLLVTGAPVERSGFVSVLVTGNEVHLVYPTGFTGYLTVSGDEMKGELDGLNPANVVLRRLK